MIRHRFSIAALAAVLLPLAAQEKEDSAFHERRSRAFHSVRLSKQKPGAAAAARLSAVLAMKDRKPLAGFDRVWKSIGPRPTVVLEDATSAGPPIASGRITSVAIDPRRSGEVVYIGAAHGGVWKTVDSGRNWLPLTDNQPSLAIGSLAIDPSNPDTVYAGTGEENFDDFDNYFGAGILKTTDGGTTWTLLAATEFGGPVSENSGGARIGAIVVHPSNSSLLFAAVDGRRGEHSGIYRSRDAGVTWDNVLKGAPGTAVVFDPRDPSTLFAGLGDKSARTASGIYKSTDGGSTWTRSNQGIPAGIGRVSLSIGPGNPSILYAAVADANTGNQLGVFKSTDAGATWAGANGPDYCSGTCFWANTIQVSPRDPDLVFVAGLQVFMTRNGGKTWSSVSEGANGNYIHWDVHAIVFDPDGRRVYVGTDGGMYRADNVADTHIRELGWNNVNDTLAITQFYPGCSGQLRQTDFIICGSQDNGVQMYTGGSTWRMIAGGDGGFTAMDSTRPSVFYFSSAGLISVSKSSPFTSFKGFLQVTSGLEKIDAADCFLPPLALDPAFPQRLYYGCRAVFRSDDGGGHWVKVSEDLPDDATYTFLSVSPTNSQKMYAATSNGRVEVSDNATGEPNEVPWRATRDLPKRGVSSVVVDPLDANVAYATVHGFSGFQDELGHVFKTTDSGRRWRDVSGDLPNIPANIIAFDPDNARALFVGTDIGVFRTADDGATWTPVGVGLPHVPVVDLRLYGGGQILRAATHGRGMWELSLAALPRALTRLQLHSGRLQTSSARVTGIGFTPESIARWNGETRPTRHVDNLNIDVELTKDDLKGGRHTVTVRDPSSGLVSNPIDVDHGDDPEILSIGNGAVAVPVSKAPIAACPANSRVALAAGMIATVRGRNLAPITARVSAASVGQTLGGAIVEFRSTTAHESYIAPILSVSPTRIDFQVPLNVPLGEGLQFDVVQGTHMSQKVCVKIDKFKPGLFSATVVKNAKRPAKKGELLRIVATGLGPYWQEPGNKTMETIATPQAHIGGHAAEVTVSEAIQPFVGRYAVTVRIPASAPSGASVPVQLTAGGHKSNVLTIAVE